jgi:hypothetical protein
MSESSSELTQLQPIGLKNRIDNNLKLSIPKPNSNFNIRNYPSTAPADHHQKRSHHQLGDLTMVKNLIRNLERVDDSQDYFSNTSPLSSSSSPAVARSSKIYIFLHINFRIFYCRFSILRTLTHRSVY